MAIEGVHIVFYKAIVWTHCNKKGYGQSTQVVLLYKRTHDAPIHPGYWALFGGKKDANDQDEKAVLERELIKEKELQVRDMSDNDYKSLLQKAKDLAVVSVVKYDGIKLIKYLKANLNREMDSLQLGRHPEEHKVEGEGLGWFTEEEIHHLWLRPEDREALNRFFHP